jgi:hypothetical protein
MFINSKLKVKNKEMIGLAKFKFLKIYYKKLDHQFIEVYSFLYLDANYTKNYYTRRMYANFLRFLEKRVS